MKNKAVSFSQNFIFAFALSTSTLTLTACLPNSDVPDRAEIVKQESEALNNWFSDRYEDSITRSPISQTYLGRDTGKDRLNDNSALAIDEEIALQKAWRADMLSQFDIDRLDAQTELSYRLFEYNADDAVAAHDFADHNYVFQHMSGPHSFLPSFMINFHSVKTKDDALAYIERLKQFQAYLGNAAERAQTQYDAGISLPKFVYAKIKEASQNVIKDAPFTESETDSPLYSDIKSKIDKLEISEDEKVDLLISARAALLNSVLPAYQRLIAQFDEHELTASTDDGIWKLPQGKAYYAERLKHYTTTDMTGSHPK